MFLRQVLFQHRQALIEQLKVTEDPALVLHLTSVLLFQFSTHCMLHAPGRSVPQIISFLSSKIPEVFLSSFLRGKYLFYKTTWKLCCMSCRLCVLCLIIILWTEYTISLVCIVFQTYHFRDLSSVAINKIKNQSVISNAAFAFIHRGSCILGLCCKIILVT